MMIIPGAPCLSSPPTPRNGRVFCSGVSLIISDICCLNILGVSLMISHFCCPNILGKLFPVNWQCAAIPTFLAVHLKADLFTGYLQVVKTSAASVVFRGTRSPTRPRSRSCSATTGCGTPSRIASLSANHLVRTEVAVSRTTSACAER